MNKTALDQYEEIVTDALKSCSAKLRKSFKTAFIQLMILYMVLPRKINFTQMGRYSDSSEQRFRQLFEREFDRMQFNLFLMRQCFGESTRKAIAIDASYISKSGKKTPYIGKFWSGCASAMKRVRRLQRYRGSMPQRAQNMRFQKQQHPPSASRQRVLFFYTSIRVPVFGIEKGVAAGCSRHLSVPCASGVVMSQKRRAFETGRMVG